MSGHVSARKGNALSDGNRDGSGADLLAAVGGDGSDKSGGDDGELHFDCCWKWWWNKEGIIGSEVEML